MNRKLIFILAVSLTAFLMISTVSAENIFNIFGNGETTTENTDDNFIVGFNSKFPPFEYIDDDGNYTGFDLDLAKEVCKRNNWTFVPLEIIDWNTKELELNSDEIDCIWSGLTINGRENNYAWSKPYFNNTPVVIVKSDSNINSFSDLKGKAVEIQQGTAALDTIKSNASLNEIFNEVTEVDNYDTAMLNLKAGICDAIILDYGIANYLVAEKYPDCKILDESNSNEQYGIGFKKGNTELRDQVQKTLDEMYKDGTVDKIAQNYSKYNLPERVIHP